jgi:hypothetical protein
MYHISPSTGVPPFIFLWRRNPMEDRTIHFITSNSWGCSRASNNVFLLPRRSSRLLLRPLMLLSSPSFRIVPWSFTSLLHSGPFCRLLKTTSPLLPRPLGFAGRARGVIRLQMAVSLLRDPQSPWIHFFGCWGALRLDSGPHISPPVLW